MIEQGVYVVSTRELVVGVATTLDEAVLLADATAEQDSLTLASAVVYRDPSDWIRTYRSRTNVADYELTVVIEFFPLAQPPALTCGA